MSNYIKKMRLSNLFILTFVIVTSQGCANPLNHVLTVNSYDEINKTIRTEAKKFGAEHVLAVFDFDDTVMTMPEDLGSVPWFDWQVDLLKSNPQSTALVAHSFAGILKEQQQLFEETPMLWVEPVASKDFHAWQDANIKTIFATARSPNLIHDTEEELQQHHLQPTALQAQNPFSKDNCPELQARPIVYQNGVTYLSGQNKGIGLTCLLKHSAAAKQIQSIIFVDDTPKNVTAVCQKLQQSPNLKSLTCLRYAGLEKKQKTFFHSPERQHAANHLWKIKHEQHVGNSA